jgi:hypothetical protein
MRVGLVYTWWALIDEHNRICCRSRGVTSPATYWTRRSWVTSLGMPALL